MKKYLLLFLISLPYITIAMDTEPLHNKPTQPIIQINDECIVCLEEAQKIEKKYGANHLRITDCCNQFLCGECLKQTVASQIKNQSNLECPHCRRTSLKVLLATKASVQLEQKKNEPLQNNPIQSKPKKAEPFLNPNNSIDRYILFKQNPPVYLTSSISTEDKLYRAILNDSAEEVRFAIEQGADVNRKYCGHFGNKPPLAVAVALTKSKAVETLLECRAPYNDYQPFPTILNTGRPCRPYHGDWTCNYSAKTLLQISLSLGDIKSALALLRHKICNIQYQESNIDWLDQKHANNLKEIIQNVLKNFDQVPNICLDFMQELINQGYKINNSRGPANIWSIALEECNIQNITLLLNLLHDNNLEIPEYVYPHRSRVTTPLFLAIGSNNIDVVRFLCAAGANLNQKRIIGKKQHTPLSYAESIRQTKPQIIQLLKDNGAPPKLPPCAYIHSFKPFRKILNRLQNTAIIKFNRPITRATSDLFLRLFMKKEQQLNKCRRNRNLSNLIKHVIELDTFMNQVELQKIVNEVNNSL